MEAIAARGPSTPAFGGELIPRSLAQVPPWPVAPPDPADWPSLWARCWSRIRSWRVPPRWSPRDWWDEARAQGALASCEALRDFDPARLVPRDAFLYRRISEGVWTRYRQEWSFGRRCLPNAPLPDRAAAEVPRPDPDLLACLAALDEPERRLIRQTYWDGRTEDQVARDLGVSRQAVNKRKRRVLTHLGPADRGARRSRAVAGTFFGSCAVAARGYAASFHAKRRPQTRIILSRRDPATS